MTLERGDDGKPNSALSNSWLFLCASPLLLDASPLLLDASLPLLDASPLLLDASPLLLDASLPSLDASPPLLDASLPSLDASLPLLDASLPLLDASLPSLDASFPLLDASLPLRCTTTLKATPKAALGDRPGVTPSILLPIHQNDFAASLCACPIGKKLPPSHNPVAARPKQHRSARQDPRKLWSRWLTAIATVKELFQ